MQVHRSLALSLLSGLFGVRQRFLKARAMVL